MAACTSGSSCHMCATIFAALQAAALPELVELKNTNIRIDTIRGVLGR